MNASQEMSLAEGLRSVSHPAQFMRGCGWLAWLGWLGGVAGKVAWECDVGSCPDVSNLLNLGSSLDTKRGSGDLRTGGYMFPASLRRAVNVFIYILIHDISIDMYVIYICREFYVHTYLHTYTRFLETSRTLDSQHFLLFLP